jgi:hypothetical protein
MQRPANQHGTGDTPGAQSAFFACIYCFTGERKQESNCTQQGPAHQAVQDRPPAQHKALSVKAHPLAF